MTATTEDYLKTILEIQRLRQTSLASMGEIADVLSLTPGTVSTMVQRLSSEGLVDYEPRKGCKLTDTGSKIALRTLRRHRLLETFLVDSLGMDWGEVHIEAEAMEHAVSDLVIERLWTFLGEPQNDPHGSPIPGPDLQWPEFSDGIPLDRIKADCRVRLIHIPDRNASLLKALENAGISPGAEILAAYNEGTGSTDITGQHGTVSLSPAVAATLLVRMP